MGYPDAIVRMAREYISLTDSENSGNFGGDEISELEAERHGLHNTLNQYLCDVWKKREVQSIAEMYNLCKRIIMGSNMGGR